MGNEGMLEVPLVETQMWKYFLTVSFYSWENLWFCFVFCSYLMLSTAWQKTMPGCLCWAANTCWLTLQIGKERLWRRCRIRQISSLLKICKFKKMAKCNGDQHLIHAHFKSVWTAVVFSTISSISSSVCETHILLYLLQKLIHIKSYVTKNFIT